MTGYRVILSRQAVKDKALLKQAGIDGKARALLELIGRDPFARPPAYEKLCGELDGFYSRRITRQHRLVYSVDAQERVIRVLRMWTHYEGIN